MIDDQESEDVALNKLFGLPDRIRECELKIMGLQIKLKNHSEMLTIKESKAMLDICNIIDENGKAVFSNESKRDAELSRRKVVDNDWKSMVEEFKRIDYDLQTEKITLTFLNNEFKMLRSVTDFISRKYTE